jgi:chorismate mutase / prephenate dehydratase
MNVRRLRESIDEIDTQLVALLNKRARLAQEVGIAKGQGQMFSPAREAEVLKQVLELNDGPFTKESLSAVYREIIACCLSLEQPLSVSYLGPTGTYSEEAARNRFGAPAVLVPCATLDEVLQAAEKQKADVAVVPVENSTEGTVNRTLDLLFDTPLQIIGELDLAIHHQLLTEAQSLEAVTTIAAHPQALAQCHDWLHKHLPKAKQVAMDSNAQAAQQAKGKPHMAAIAGKLAARQYELPVLTSDIEDDSSNTTRFVMLGSIPVPPTGEDKTALICSVPNRPGALGKLITVFSDAGINMTKLASRPSPTGLWDYVFYIDIDGHQDEPAVKTALEKLNERALFVKILGSYPKTAK